MAAMLASILGTHLTVGLLTSPHVTRFNERFRVSGIEISDDQLVRCVERVRPLFESIERSLPQNWFISPMGIQAAVALSFFEESGCDVAVLECGKGAAYDDVCNVPHKYAAINTVFLEHTRELGKTVRAIARDKAAVIGEGTRFAYVGPQAPEAMNEIDARAREFGAQALRYGADYLADNVEATGQGLRFDIHVGDECSRGVRLSMLGEYQARNCSLAVALSQRILSDCGMRLGLNDILCSGVRDALARLRLPGRLEVVSDDPLVILDACVNRASCAEVLEVLRQLGVEEVTKVLGIPADKDFIGVAEAISAVRGRLILTTSSNPHYHFDEAQEVCLRERGIDAAWEPSCQNALETARSYGLPVVVLGTTSLISDVCSLRHEGFFTS